MPISRDTFEILKKVREKRCQFIAFFSKGNFTFKKFTEPTITP